MQGWDLAAASDPDVPDLLVDASLAGHRAVRHHPRGGAHPAAGDLLDRGTQALPRTTAVRGRVLGWIAALLFATVPIRNFFPGSPPPGSWVDVLVVLWVIVALTVGLLIGVAAFIKHPRPSP